MVLGLVVACTNGKAAEPRVRLGEVRQRVREASPGRLFDCWATEVDGSASDATVTAQDLYAGAAWAASMDAADALRGIDAASSTWVLSAGYGLVSVNDQLVPYSATFSPGASDSVASSSGGYHAANLRWWQHLMSWRPNRVDGPRSFAELADHVDALMVVMSPRYLLAAEGDLLAAAQSGIPLVIVSGGLARDGRLAAHAVDFDKRLREPEEATGAPRLVRASDMSLNQRVAEQLVASLGQDAFDLPVASAYLEAEMGKRAAARTFGHREAATDEQVLDFIECALLADGNPSKTRLLAEWRASGRQCEQKRFGHLFDQARETVQLAGLANQEELAL